MNDMGPAHGHDRRTDTAWVDEMGINECWGLLATAPVGRIGFVHGRPVVLPVNHVVDGESVVFRTDDDSSLGALVDGDHVSFEVDQYDADAKTGWSVVVAGTVRNIDRAARRTIDASPPWVPSRGDRWLRVVPERVTGRRLHRRRQDAAGHYLPAMPPD